MRIIAGEARGRIIEAPKGMNTRPTLDRVRENIFNMIQQDVPDSTVLDLFAGSGAMSLEALSRGASRAVLVDSDRNANAVQKKNIETLRYGTRAKTMLCDWRQAAERLRKDGEKFDLVILDPPYAMTNLRDVFSMIRPLIHEDSLIVLEHESGKGITVPETYVQERQRSWGFCALSIYRLT